MQQQSKPFAKTIAKTIKKDTPWKTELEKVKPSKLDTNRIDKQIKGSKVVSKIQEKSKTTPKSKNMRKSI